VKLLKENIGDQNLAGLTHLHACSSDLVVVWKDSDVFTKMQAPQIHSDLVSQNLVSQNF
jgi:hypothetical protein